VPVFVNDTFTDPAGTLLTAHTGEIGATWASHPLDVGVYSIANNRAYRSGTGRIIYASGSPAGAEYDIEADYYVVTDVEGMHLLGRLDATALTYYSIRHYLGVWTLQKRVAGGTTDTLASTTQGVVAATNYAIKLEIRDAAKKFSVGGSVLFSITNNEITAAGKVGFREIAATTATTGKHIDRVWATDALAPPPVQFARPATDVTDGTWTDQAGGLSLFAAIGEAVAADADYIRSANATTTADVSEIALGTIIDPGVSTGHIVRYRYGKDTAAGDVVNLTVSLRQGTATEIAAWTHLDIPQGPIDAAQTLTAAQADAITTAGYSDLRLRFSSVKA